MIGARRGIVSAMKRYLICCALALSLTACSGQFKNPFEGLRKKPAPQETVVETPQVVTPVEEDKPAIVEVGGGGQTADALDKTTKAEKEAATAAPAASSATLGTTVASLGDPTEQGFWLRTPLVDAVTDGSVETEGGAVVQVKLIPIDGPASAGSRISLAAMRALDLGLTDLATLIVSKG